MTSRFIANSHSFPPTLTSCGYVKSERGHEVAVPGYSGLQQPPKPSQDENNPRKRGPGPRSDSPGPEACLSTLSRVVYIHESESQPPLAQGKTMGLLTVQWPPLHYIKILLSCLSTSGRWGKKALSRCQALDLDF